MLQVPNGPDCRCRTGIFPAERASGLGVAAACSAEKWEAGRVCSWSEWYDAIFGRFRPLRIVGSMPDTRFFLEKLSRRPSEISGQIFTSLLIPSIDDVAKPLLPRKLSSGNLKNLLIFVFLRFLSRRIQLCQMYSLPNEFSYFFF